MKMNNNFWVTVLVALILQGCDSLDSGEGTLPLVPDAPPEIDLSTPRPSKNAVVVTSQGNGITDYAQQTVLVRGANVQFSQSPLDGIASIEALKEVGANTVRIQLLDTTTADELDAALNAAASQGLLAMVTLGDEVDGCNDDRDYLDGLVDDVWLSKWISVLSKDKYQPYLMINIANSWGPKGVFDSSASISYSGYMDAYKVQIRRFRQAGLNVPLAIDAPGCGMDHHAFMGGRAFELLSADIQENIVLSVHARGSRWNSFEKWQANLTDLQGLSVPFIISEFDGSSSSEERSLIDTAMGDNALLLDLPWSSEDNRVAYSYSMSGLANSIMGTVLSFDVFLAQSYIDDAQLQMQVYFVDDGGRIAKADPVSMQGIIRNRWNNISVAITSMESFTELDSGFDESSVEYFGVQFNANGKTADVSGVIKIDNVDLEKPSTPIYSAEFALDVEGWACRGWLGEWTEEVCIDKLDYGSQALIINPPWNSSGSDGRGIALGFDGVKDLTPTVDLIDGFVYSFDLFIPEEYSDENGIVVQPYINDASWAFASLAYIQSSALNFGAWNNISITMDDLAGRVDSTFILDAPPSRFGLQILNVKSPKTEALIVDNIRVTDLPEVRMESIYEARYTDEENWILGFGAGMEEENAIYQEEGALAVLPTWGGETNQTMARYDYAGVLSTPIDPSSPLIISFDVLIPTEYASESSFFVQAFINDAFFTGFAAFGYTGISSLVLGEWNTITIPINDFAIDAGFITDVYDMESPPAAFGVQISGVNEVKSSPVLIDNFSIVMDVGGSIGESLLALNFDSAEEVSGFSVNESEALTDTAWLSTFTAESKTQGYGINPFGWLAWVWYGYDEASAEFSLSNQSAVVDLTERGESIIEGLSGIGVTSVPVNFPDGYQPNTSSSSSSSSTSSSSASSSSSSTSSSSSSSSGILSVVNGGLEVANTTSPWRGNGPSVLSLSAEARSASASLLVTDRTSNWHGAGQDLNLESGKRYLFSVWVKTENADASVSLTLKKVDESNAGEGSYTNIASSESTSAGWVELKGSYDYSPVGVVSELFLYVESADETVSYYLDDLRVVELQVVTAQIEVINGDLEVGELAPWVARGDSGVSISLDSTEYRSGANALLVEGRTANWHGQEYKLDTNDFIVGQDYTFSVWVKMADTNDTLRLSLSRADEGDNPYLMLGSDSVTSDEWVELSGVYTHTANGVITDLSVYVESPTVDASYYVDDLSISSTQNVQNISGLSAGKSKFLGNIIASSIPQDFNDYWNQVSPENAGKWGSVESTRDVMDWSQLDQIYEYAKARNLPFKLHVLVWGSQEPSWMADLVAQEAWTEIADEVEQWIAAAAKRYPDTDMIDVVNEAQHAPASYRQALGGDGATGWDWIIWSFEKAREYFPKAQLHLNDYGIINDPSAIIVHKEIAQLLQDRSLIDAIAIQAHQFNVDSMSSSDIITNLDALASSGLPIYVSELDITGLEDPHDPSNFDAASVVQEDRQEDRYQEVFSAFWEHSSVKGITLWGYRESATWKAGTGIQNADGTKRKALTWLESYLSL